VNQIDGVAHAHASAGAFHAHHGFHPLRKIFRTSIARRVVLRVSLPIPARRSVLPHRTLRLRQVQKRLYGLEFSSRPSTCPISTLRRSSPHKQQMRAPGGGVRFAR
jgi:hypothetical protein